LKTEQVVAAGTSEVKEDEQELPYMDYFQRKNPDQYQPTCSMPPPASKLDVAKKDASQWMDCVEPFWEWVFHGFPILNPIFISKSR